MSKLQTIQRYTVQPGDTLAKIAEKFYGDFRQVNYLAATNGIANPDILKAGQVLVIPVLSSYASVQPAVTTNFAASPRAAADTLITQLEQQNVNIPSVQSFAASAGNVPSPDEPVYTAGTGGDLGTVTASATKLMPMWMTVTLIAAGLYILFGDKSK